MQAWGLGRVGAGCRASDGAAGARLLGVLAWQRGLCAIIPEGPAGGPIAYASCPTHTQELRELIDEQPREAERIIKRDKRSSYFRCVSQQARHGRGRAGIGRSHPASCSCLGI
jgi:hypothetical protein